MSWSITVNDIQTVPELPEDTLEAVSKDNPAYRTDAILAFEVGKDAGMVSCTLSGGRTPSPYGGPDTVTISVVGFDSHKEGHAVPPPDFNEAMMQTILTGPDDE